MVRTSLTLIVSQSLIDIEGNNEFGRNEGGGNKTNLSNSFVSKKSIGTSYLTFKNAKKGDGNPNSSGGNTKKCVKANKDFNYQIIGIKKAFNIL